MTNEAYAEEHFVGKRVEITGKVVRISVSKYGSPDRVRQDHYLLSRWTWKAPARARKSS